MRLTLWLLMLAMTLGQAQAAPAADPAALNRIVFAKSDQALAESVARALQRNLRRNGDGDWPIVVLDDRTDEKLDGAIALGPALALRSGLVSPTSLQALPPEGYEVRLQPGLALVAGRSTSALMHGIVHLQRLMGYHAYPWRDGNELHAVLQMPQRWSPPTALTVARDQPWFLWRDINNHLDGGKFGSSIRSQVLGDPQQAANPELFGPKRKDYSPFTIQGSDYVDWFHTAAYLVPRDLYYKDHLEYFAIKGGQRIGPDRYVRMALCETHPDVWSISAQRAVKWMDLQPTRQFFSVVPSDAPMCECPTCLASDPLPNYYTDRMLRWVNHVADAARQAHPDKTLLTAGYLQTVKPPLLVEPASNVVVLYAPWFWNSRTTSAHTLASPLNVIAMRELAGWLAIAPDRVGIYDYPGDHALGTAWRIKQYARMGIRHTYLNGPEGDLLHWLSARLTWDPTQDLGPLLESFCRASYGPAWQTMAQLEREYAQVQVAWGRHGRSVWRRIQQNGPSAPRAAFDRLASLARQAGNEVRSNDSGADPATRVRTWAAALARWRDVLLAVTPHASRPDLRCSEPDYQRSLADYRALTADLLAATEALPAPRLLKRLQREAERFETQISESSPQPNAGNQAGPDLFDRTIANDDQARATTSQPADGRTGASLDPWLRWDQPDHAGTWQVDASAPGVASPAQSVELPLVGGPQRGVRIHAALTRLPTEPVAKLALHAGRCYARTDLPSPLPRRNQPFVYWHLHATAPAVATLYLDDVRSDVTLHAGEQVVRVDLRAMDPAKVHADVWPAIRGIGIDLWPQDGEYPHAPAQDVSVTVLGLAQGSEAAISPRHWPGGEQALWLSAFHANVPHQLSALALAPQRFRRLRQPEDRSERERHSVTESFRSFTEHRRLTPILAIHVTDASLRPLAQRLADRLHDRFGVRLAIAQGAVTDTQAVVLCRLADLGPSWQRHAAWLGQDGFLIDACDGRIRLAGSDELAIAQAAARYLADHAPAAALGLTADTDPWLHELMDLDRPWFAPMPDMRDADPLATQPLLTITQRQREQTLALAAEVKHLARAGREAWPADLRRRILEQALARRLAATWCRDPFADSDDLIQACTTDAPRHD
jgi:hypothetical protein